MSSVILSAKCGTSCWYCGKLECSEYCPAHRRREHVDMTVYQSVKQVTKKQLRNRTRDDSIFMARWVKDIRVEFQQAVARVKVFKYLDTSI